MAKVITKIGACSTRKQAIGVQFIVTDGGAALGGSYAISGDKAVVSEEALPAKLTVGDSFKRSGCRCCGNKFAYICGSCGRVICYDGNAKRNAECPACGVVADVPATVGDRIPSNGASPRAVGGDTVDVAQGQEVTIKLPNNQPLTKIIVGVGWDPARGGERMDVDSSVIVAGNGGYETVFYGNLRHPSGCVEHHGDNLTGESRGGNGDDENITVYLDKVPSDRDKLIFVLNIYSCVSRHQTLRDVRNMYIFLYDPSSGKPLIRYSVDPSMNNDTAIVIGAVYRRGREWTFKAIGEGSLAVNVHDLAAEVVRRY